MIRVVRLVRVKETKTTVVFEEDLERIKAAQMMPVFGPQGRIYLSKDVVGDGQEVLVKVEVVRL